MKTLKTILLTILTLISLTKINAQQDTYKFDYIYKMQIETPRGRTTVIDYYLPSEGGYFGSKNNGTFQVFDNNLNKMYMFMGIDSEDNDKKTVMAMPFDLKEFVKKFNDEEDSRVYKSVGYASILGYHCELYRMISDNLTSEVWVARDIENGTFATNTGTNTIFGYLLGRSIRVNDASFEGTYAGLPLKIVTKKRRGRKEKITTMQCIKFERKSFQINTSEYRKLF